ncbi:uncharacterized protein LOC135475402 [Liolophura sinensis]|uniref:uncharacterized protein LOC135475402 n=1 Tax=Liolophura sinensis TaxID=3198878 RepID=UPI00315842FC
MDLRKTMEGFCKTYVYIVILFLVGANGRALNEVEQRKVDRFVLDSMNCGRIPAINLGLVRDGQIALTKGYGTADARDRIRTTDSTVFCLASLTEAFTALTLGKLLSRNDSYSWDTPVKEFLGEDFRLGNKYITNHVTLRDLVSHRTGLAGGDGIILTKGMGQSELKNRLFFMESHTGFRAKQTESKILFTLVQAALEAIGGKPWDLLVKEHLLNPIGMTLTKFLHEAEPSYRKFAVPMIKVNGNLTHVPWDAVNSINLAGSAGSLCSTAYDMSKWIDFLLKDGKNLRGHTVVRKDILAELFEPVTILDKSNDVRSDDFNQPGTTVSYSENRAGLGWTLGSYRGYKTVSKRGSWLGYESQLTMIPSRRVGVFTSFTGQTGNKADAIKSLISVYALDILLDGEPWVDVPRVCSTVDEMVNAMPKPRSSYRRTYLRTDISPHRPLQSYAGSYGNGLYGRLEISVSNDTRNALNLDYGEQGMYRLFPTQKLDEFYLDAKTGPLWFTTRADEYIRWGPILVSFNSTKQEREAERAQRKENEPQAEDGGSEEESEESEDNEDDEEDEDRISGIAIPSFDRTLTPIFRRDFVLKQAFKDVQESHYEECSGASAVTIPFLVLALTACLNFISHRL